MFSQLDDKIFSVVKKATKGLSTLEKAAIDEIPENDKPIDQNISLELASKSNK